MQSAQLDDIAAIEQALGYARMVVGQPNNDRATLGNARKAARTSRYAMLRIADAIEAETFHGRN